MWAKSGAKWALLLGLLAAIAAVLAITRSSTRGGDEDVLAAAAAFPDGGGYDPTWKSTGSPEDVVFQGTTILAKSPKGTYCSGFTFAVAMRVAERRKLLAKCTAAEARRFQREWFGATLESREKQCVVAAQSLGIGVEKTIQEAQPGDFVQFWRSYGTGHSVVSLRWIAQDGQIIGLEYRSAQRKTDGIGNRTEYFADAKGKSGAILRDRTYVCRLNAR